MKMDEYLNRFDVPLSDIARAIGRSESVVSRYARGEMVPPLVVAWKICQASGHAVRLEDFVPESEK